MIIATKPETIRATTCVGIACPETVVLERLLLSIALTFGQTAVDPFPDTPSEVGVIPVIRLDQTSKSVPSTVPTDVVPVAAYGDAPGTDSQQPLVSPREVGTVCRDASSPHRTQALRRRRAAGGTRQLQLLRRHLAASLQQAVHHED
jgi:hypothetical protein